MDLIRLTTQGNALIGVFSANWDFIIDDKDQSNNNTFHTVPIILYSNKNNTTCSCATSKFCSKPATTYDFYTQSDYEIKGLVFGCFLLEAILQSSLSCFYSQECIQNFRNVIDISDRWNESDCNGQPCTSVLFDSTTTRFQINDTIETIAYDMFIESWTNNVSYEKFFNACKPKYCIYTYYYRFDALDMLTSFLSIFAGLCVGYRFAVPHPVTLVGKIKYRFTIACA